MKNMCKVLGMIALIAVVGFFASCGNPAGDDETTYTVTFNSNGGSTEDSITVEDGKAAGTLPIPTRGSDNFVGWFKDNTTFAEPFTSVTIVTGNITVYAKWTTDDEDQPKSITITGMAGLGDVTVSLNVSSVFNVDSVAGALDINIVNEEVTANLVKDEEGTPWTGSGEYYLMLVLSDERMFLYTNGGALPDPNDYEDPHGDEYANALAAAVQRFNITNSNTISFSKFKEPADLSGE